MRLQVARSSDINGLVRALGEQLQGDLQQGQLDLFHPASIIVPHVNLARWASLRLAQQLGIAASLEFPYLESTHWQAMAGHDSAPQPPTRLDVTTLQRGLQL
jgi:exonuclease V gamma subunit